MFDRREMIMAHDMFRRELGLMPGLVRAVAPGDTERARVISEHIGHVMNILHHHHYTEDEHLWPLLEQRCAPETGPIVELMSGQHEEVAELGRAADAALAAWGDGAAGPARDALAGILGQLAAVLRNHLGLEEEHVVPLIVAQVTAAEWGQILEKMTVGIPPEHLVVTFGMMMYEGDPEVIDATVTSMPPEVAPVMKQLAGEAFAAHSLLVHGTATPPRSTELPGLPA
jgi:hemerythrin-like domain-containing protein